MVICAGIQKVQDVPAEGANITRVVFIVQGLYAKK